MIVRVQNIVSGSRVRQNYQNGHGLGMVEPAMDNRFKRLLGFEVVWDSGAGTFQYSHTAENQEIALAKQGM